MRRVGCEQCGQVLPMNDMFIALGRSLCEPCTEAELTSHAEGELPKDAVKRQVDPTVCAVCEEDNGDVELKALAGKPVCERCEESYRNRPYPRWLKIAFVTLVVLAVASFARNWRFVVAYVEERQAERAFKEGKFDRASDLMSDAAAEAPESKEIQRSCSACQVSGWRRLRLSEVESGRPSRSLTDSGKASVNGSMNAVSQGNAK
jgi:hypothetical protein